MFRPRLFGSRAEKVYRSRSHLTEMLWRDRYARGHILDGALANSSSSSRDLEKIEPMCFDTTQPRLMSDSFCQVILPFRTDLDLREDYVNSFRGLRFGKILEDLDALAGSIAFRHCSLHKPTTSNSSNNSSSSSSVPLKIVTASVDRIDLLHLLRPDFDLKLSGNVTYTGNSSMEVTIRVESLGKPDFESPIDMSGEPLPDNLATWTSVCLCKFTMVARNAETNAAATVNPLIPNSKLEARIIEMGAKRKEEKLHAIRTDLRKQPPLPEERILIHQLWLESEQYAKSSQSDRNIKQISFPAETTQQLVRIMHPQERNVHSSIFGGYLMREAFELAYTTAMLYINGRPYTVALDDISFSNPVPIGSVLFLTSQVVYAEGEPHRTFQVKVTAEVSRNYNDFKNRVQTNTFYITFARGAHLNQAHSPQNQVETAGIVNRLLPQSYTDSMEYLRGKRRKERGIAFKTSQLDEFEQLRLQMNIDAESINNTSVDFT